jgi:putative transposase
MTMLVQRGYVYRLEPTGRQRRLFARTAGAARWVYNWGLRHNLDAVAATGKRHSYADLCRLLTGQKRDPVTRWLNEPPSHCLQQALRDLDTAYTNFFGDLRKLRAGALRPDEVRRPVFKKKGRSRESFRYPDPTQFAIDGDHIRLPKAGRVRIRLSRPIDGQVRSATVFREGEHWFVSVLVQRESAPRTGLPTSAVGVDLGIAQSITLSTGDVVELPTPTARQRAHLQRLHRRVSRKSKGSNNRSKARERLARFQRKLARRRYDALHKVTTELAENQGIVVIEDLGVKQMSRAGGARKRGLNRSIAEQSWGTFRRLLDYKLAERGSQLVVVNPAYTSQRCSRCGHTATENRPSQPVFRCVSCEHEDNADINAALNILAAGHAASACGGDVSLGAPSGLRAAPVKQEPAGRQHVLV